MPSSASYVNCSEGFLVQFRLSNHIAVLRAGQNVVPLDPNHNVILDIIRGSASIIFKHHYFLNPGKKSQIIGDIDEPSGHCEK